MFHRLLVRKRPHFAPEILPRFQRECPQLRAAQELLIYDLHGAPEQLPAEVLRLFIDPVSDERLPTLPDCDFLLPIEALPGQFDQRADSAEQCLGLIAKDFAEVRVRCSTAYLFWGTLNAQDRDRLRALCLNPIENREKELSETQLPSAPEAPAVPYLSTFGAATPEELRTLARAQGLAMSAADLSVVQAYFRAQGRAPSETELRVLDTYWSDHCRHKTFHTTIDRLDFPESPFGQYLKTRVAAYHQLQREVRGDAGEETLMELATLGARAGKRAGTLSDVEFSKEINACSVFVEVDEGGKTRPWLLQFKNETHNHPTEIEPFGGASTCIGGAIRDPLSGRAYVYQALRISGAADPREYHSPIAGKLPQQTIARGAAAGASSYGNQIGLATGQVVEFYHEGYRAKHMEVGAVVGAVPAAHVRREEPQAGDVVLLLGGATGRDGCGGATGSSQSHHQASLHQSAAEVQKGNAPEERKLQRLFRRPEFSQQVKRCNDFGAGGVSVAIGELAAGLEVDLDAVPVKYQGLSGTELAISESQERMAIVVAPEAVAAVQAMATAENLSATVVAKVTDEPRLVMRFRGQVIVDLARTLLDSGGAPARQASARLPEVDFAARPAVATGADWRTELQSQLATLKFADQRGLGAQFDHSVGAACVLLPYGGKTQRTPSEASVYTLPTEQTTTTASVLAFGFDPELSAWSPYHGGTFAVVEATARLVAAGGDARRAHYSLQEYFPRLGDHPERWGLPYAALLGAHDALRALGRAAIGGKDSMSGSFEQLSVPPTLIAFAVTTLDARRVVSPEFKTPGAKLYRLRCPQTAHGLPDLAVFAENNAWLQAMMAQGKIDSARALRHGGLIQALYECALGNELGVAVTASELFAAEYGAYLLSAREPLSAPHLEFLGEVLAVPRLEINGQAQALAAFSAPALSAVYPLYALPEPCTPPALAQVSGLKVRKVRSAQGARPRVCLPVFSGTNSELDTRRAFERAGAVVDEGVFCNRNRSAIEESIARLVKSLDQAEILTLSGGFSAGDEPDGSGKFIVAVLSQPQVAEAVERLLARDGLILGICNGFQALIKSGLILHGHLGVSPQSGDPTLTHNLIGRHVARVVHTVVANCHSPWLSDFEVGAVTEVAISHGEGRLVGDPARLAALQARGQIATQYADAAGQPSLLPEYNPNGSLLAIEGLTSACGRVYGKMGHSERHQLYGQQNFPNFRGQEAIFRSGVRAFTSL